MKVYVVFYASHSPVYGEGYCDCEVIEVAASKDLAGKAADDHVAENERRKRENYSILEKDVVE